MNRSGTEQALKVVLDDLMARRRDGAWWSGRLSSSAVATATAVSALSAADRNTHAGTIASAIGWLLDTQNDDGGWGDTPCSPSNLPATVLTISALRLADMDDRTAPARRAAWGYLGDTTGLSVTGADLAPVILRHYGDDRTFSVPILVNAALAGLVDWSDIPRLPYELTLLPHSLYRSLRLEVVSYALPALIALGVAIDHRQHRRLSARAWLARAARRAALAPPAAMPPPRGGALEAVPLTSFVTMALAPIVGRDHPVIARCIGFLNDSIRPDGSWPIDTDLSVWVTTKTVLALDAANRLDLLDTDATADWIVAQQHRSLHPYTRSAPGGWAWTHRPGGVPDTDDTSGALLALHRLGRPQPAPAGVRWLLGLQNADGGWPTFCRGWNRLPFDTSCPDLAAHALHALAAWSDDLRIDAPASAVESGFDYLRASQRPDGSWRPLWFGNQHAPGQFNPVLGTAFVLDSLLTVAPSMPVVGRGMGFLLRSQNDDGGWGGAPGVSSTVEETALAASVLAHANAPGHPRELERAAAYLVDRVAQGAWKPPQPIGLYFASLWYSEEIYPIVWLVQSLGRIVQRK